MDHFPSDRLVCSYQQQSDRVGTVMECPVTLTIQPDIDIDIKGTRISHLVRCQDCDDLIYF